jgi:hypothetical protein
MDTPATIFDASLDLFTTKGDLEFSNFSQQGLPDGGTAITNLTIPPTTTGMSGVFDFEFDFDSTVSDVFQDIDQWGALPAADVTVDYSANRLRHVTDFPTFDTATQKLTWTVDTTSGLDGDAFITAVSGDRTDPVSGADTFWNWSIIGPDPSGGSVTFPTLPTDVFDFAFQDTDNPGFSFLSAVKVPGGYDAIRGFAFTDFAPTQLAATGTATSQVVFSRATASLAPLRPLPVFPHKNLLAPKAKHASRGHVHVTHGTGTMRK